MTTPSRPRLWVVLFLIAFAVYLPLTAAIFYFMQRMGEREVLENSKLVAERIIERNLAIHSYINKKIKPALFPLLEDRIQQGYFDPAWMSSTHVVREIQGSLQKASEQGFYYKESAINARSPANEADAFERDFLERASRDSRLEEWSGIKKINGKSFYVVLRRGETMEEACLRCHSEPTKAPRGLVEHYGDKRSFGRKNGELVSVMSVRIPMEQAIALQAELQMWERLSIAVFIALTMTGLFFLGRSYVYRPLRRLQDGVRLAQKDQGILGTPIETKGSREIQEVADAFSAMSGKVKEHIEQLDSEVAKKTNEIREELELRGKAENEYRDLVDSIPDVLYRYSTRRGGLYYSRRVTELLGYPVEYLLAHPFHLTESMHPEDAHDVKVAVEKAMTGEDFSVEYRVRDSSGAWHWLSDRSTHLAMEADEWIIYGIITDITERKKAAEALDSSEKRFRSYFNLPIIGMAITSPDKGWIAANDKLCSLLGYSLEELKCLTWGELTHPDDLDANVAQFNRAVAGVIDGYSLEKRFIRKGGSVFWADLSVACVRKPDGSVDYLAAAIQDITNRKMADAIVTASEEKFSRAFQHAPAIIALTRLSDGILLDVNDRFCRISGWSREEALGKTTIELGWVTENDRERILASLADRRSVADLEIDHHARDGNVVHCLYNGEVITIGGEKCLLSLLEDVTHRLELEAQLLQSQKMEAIGTLAGGIAHDFNNILGAILGYTELTLATLPPQSEERENLQEVMSASKRAKDLVQQILAFSRKTDKRLVPVEAGRVVAEAVKLLRNVIPKTITFHSEIDPNAGLTLGDPTELHQVVMNLCTNAYQAMSSMESGLLVVKLNRTTVGQTETRSILGLVPGEYLRLEVKDTGPGMDEVTRARVFEPYFTTKGLGKGTGLGLSTVHGIVVGMGGAIDVHSRPDAGTSFTVYLPVQVEPVELAPATAPVTTAEKGKGTILLVDDEPSLIKLAAKMLSSLGYTVRSSSDPLEALRLFEGNPSGFDVIVTDQTMPGMTGTELIQRAKAIRPEVGTVICTGYSDLIDEEGAKARGVGAYVHKPYNRNTLGAAIAEASMAID